MAGRFEYSLDKFYGLNYTKDETKPGESSDMVNFSITPSFSLKKRRGYSVLCPHSLGGRGIWSGELSGKESVVFVEGKNVWLYEDGKEKLLGELESSEGKVEFLLFSKKLYILDGVKIKVCDREKISDIEPYRPLVVISTTPDGRGVAFEEKNLITGKMRQTFTMNGTTNKLQLALKDLDSIDYVKVDGVETNEYSFSQNDLKNGIVYIYDTYKNHPTDNGIEVGFTKSDGREGEVHRMRGAAVFGGENDTRVFLYSDPERADIIRWSGIHNGVMGLEYMPENSFNKLGTKTEITSVIRHYDRLLVFCRGESFYSYIEMQKNEEGKEYASFPIRPLSDTVGSSVRGFVRFIDGAPVSFDNGTLYLWKSTAIRDERYAVDIGKRVKDGFVGWDMREVFSWDNDTSKELFICHGDEIYVYNYGLDLYYFWKGIKACGFASVNNSQILFVREDGSLCRLFDSGLDDKESICASWSSGYLKVAPGYKNLHRLSLEVFPEYKTLSDLFWISDHSERGQKSFASRYSRLTFPSLDFSLFGFYTGVSPRKLTMRLRHKRFDKIKLRLENTHRDSNLHVESITLSGVVCDKK